MRKLSETQRTPRRGRVFPHITLSDEEIAQREAEMQALMQRCEVIFERIKPEIIHDCYDWFMVIEPDSGDYFIDADETVAVQKAEEKHPNAPGVVFCINETGVCDKI